MLIVMLNLIVLVKIFHLFEHPGVELSGELVQVDAGQRPVFIN